MTHGVSNVVQTLIKYQDSALPQRVNELGRKTEKIFQPGFFENLITLAPEEQEQKLKERLQFEGFSNAPLYQRIEDMYRLSVSQPTLCGYNSTEKAMLATFHRADVQLGLIREK